MATNTQELVTPSLVRRVKQLIAIGVSHPAISEQVGASVETVTSIATGQRDHLLGDAGGGRPTKGQQLERLADAIHNSGAYHLLRWDNAEPLSGDSDELVDTIGMLVDCETAPIETRWTIAEGGAL